MGSDGGGSTWVTSCQQRSEIRTRSKCSSCVGSLAKHLVGQTFEQVGVEAHVLDGVLFMSLQSEVLSSASPRANEGGMVHHMDVVVVIVGH